MGERDPRDAADRPDRRDALVVDVAEAVPEEIAAVRADEESTLADAERGLYPDAGQVRFEVAQLDALPLRAELVERRPQLPTLANVLALVLADRAAVG